MVRRRKYGHSKEFLLGAIGSRQEPAWPPQAAANILYMMADYQRRHSHPRLYGKHYSPYPNIESPCERGAVRLSNCFCTTLSARRADRDFEPAYSTNSVYTRTMQWIRTETMWQRAGSKPATTAMLGKLHLEHPNPTGSDYLNSCRAGRFTTSGTVCNGRAVKEHIRRAIAP